MEARFVQDVAPKGGYPLQNYNSYLQRGRGPTGLQFAGMIVASTVIGFGLYFRQRNNYRLIQERNQREKLAVVPYLQAETDRRYLKQLKKEQDEEAAVMKDVPGWVVGESVYKTRYMRPIIDDPPFF
eukprot:TRINITY_DN932_c0_g1_i1.p1 TRINITY_DN932_c0_g1~~TRINITY_DN932_c0_g1_i1.p1  ORF type:complete len:127 (-),score=32.85 TRINITY_DN932_c0_g1_i1:55-435(-)